MKGAKRLKSIVNGLICNIIMNLIKKIFMSKEKEKGVLAKDMNLAELKNLAVSIKLYSKEGVATMKKPALLRDITAWEEKQLSTKRETGFSKVVLPSSPVVEEEDTHNGKKVVSRTKVTVNNKEYEDILVVTGETFRNLIK